MHTKDVFNEENMFEKERMNTSVRAKTQLALFIQAALKRAQGPKIRDEDSNPVGFVDFWPAGSIPFFIGSGS